MNSIWQDCLEGSGARIDNGLVSDFGDAAAELLAARDATIISPLSHLGVIKVSGPEAAVFLHHQLTSDVKHLGGEAAQYSAWCSAKGRMLASFLVFRVGSAYQLQLSADLLPTIHKRLQMFVLRSKVIVSDQSGACAGIGLTGPQAPAVLQSAGLPMPATPMRTALFAAGAVIRLDDRRFEIVVHRGAAPALWQKLQSLARAVGTPAWQWLEIQAAVPLISERTREEFVPQMANFEKIGAVSFHKGCYPGQEIVARTQYLGKVKRHLYRAHAATPIAAGDAIYSPANPQHPCGMVVNAAAAPSGGYDSLAIVQEKFVAAADLELAAPGGPRIALQQLGD
ncbi:MAG: folate-binding protein YgfZ [Candidatus Accumulibacter sp.]|uniref:Folate-binding protein YgfZ n=1 Tax=Candidatus Accumulibacter affinis TaxID=2954384 RepID=A0A935TDJ4_9PROT|nr:folate-binding protein YgfZ [Candidatus Accumulibacter affinis]